jgi:transposase-like protein
MRDELLNMERRRFTREFKLEAVKLIKVRGVGYVQWYSQCYLLASSLACL